MKLPWFKRLMKQDLDKEAENFVEKLITPYNNALENLYLALSKRLTVQDNMSATVKDITAIVDSSGAPTTPLQFKLDKTGGTNQSNVDTILEVRVLSAKNNTNPSNFVESHPFIDFSQDGDTVTINKIKGLVAGQEYSLKIVTTI